MSVDGMPAQEPAVQEAATLPKELVDRALRERETARRLAVYLAEHHPVRDEE